MFKVFVLILSVTGQSGIATSTRSFDTKEACDVYAPELLQIIERDLKAEGKAEELKIVTWRCGTEADLTEQKL